MYGTGNVRANSNCNLMCVLWGDNTHTQRTTHSTHTHTETEMRSEPRMTCQLKNISSRKKTKKKQKGRQDIHLDFIATTETSLASLSLLTTAFPRHLRTIEIFTYISIAPSKTMAPISFIGRAFILLVLVFCNVSLAFKPAHSNSRRMSAIAPIQSTNGPISTRGTSCILLQNTVVS